jgi:prepilin-type N-terminal cleavage/methylation domain-containing protein
MIRRTHGAGFTLVELMVAVGLLAVLILMVGFIFQTSVDAISTAQGSNELNASLMGVAERLRSDIKGIERNGFLIIGAREREAYGSGYDRGEKLLQTFRNDWMVFFTATEHPSLLDQRAIGMWSRVMIGHGRVADTHGDLIQTRDSYPQGKTILKGRIVDEPEGVYKLETLSPTGGSPKVLTINKSDTYTSNTYYNHPSDQATDWILMRHQILELAYPVFGNKQTYRAWSQYYSDAMYVGAEYASYGEMVGTGGGEGPYKRAIQSHTKRKYNWYWYYGWDRENQVEIFEPEYYFRFASGAGRRFQLLPHCAEFKIQFAMKADIGNGQVLWHDPPARGNSAYPYGRLEFGPGDEWPVLLRISIQAFDPIDRLIGGRPLVMVFEVP